MPALENLGVDFGLDAKSVRFQLEGSQHLRPHHLVTGLHIGEHRVVEDVRGERDDAVAKVMREQKDAMAPEKPRAVDDIGGALANQLDEIGIFLRRILEIGVLNDDEIAGYGGEPV